MGSGSWGPLESWRQELDRIESTLTRLDQPMRIRNPLSERAQMDRQFAQQYRAQQGQRVADSFARQQAADRAAAAARAKPVRKAPSRSSGRSR